MLQAVFGPAHRNAEAAGGQPDQDDVRIDGRLDPERAAGVPRRDQPQLRTGQPQRRRRDGVQGERPLEVRPGGQRSRRLVPVADDPVALHRCAAPARKPEALAHDEVGSRQRAVDVAVLERAVVDARLGVDRRLGVEHRVERLVLDLDQLDCVLGDVTVASDHDGQRLAGVPRHLVRGGPVRHAAIDSGRKGPRHRRDVCAGQHSDDAGKLQRGARVERRDARVRDEGSENRRMAHVGQGIEIVDEPSFATQKRLVLEPG